MGAIFAVLGSDDPAAAEAAVSRIASVSPHRGVLTVWQGRGLALGIQSLGWDASMVEQNGRVFAVHGYLCPPAVSAGETPSGEAPAAELLARVWADAGPMGVVDLDGEFAVLVADPDAGTLAAVCSIAGTRPMFWGHVAGRVCVASEVRQVRAGLGLVSQLDEPQLVRMMLQRPVAEEAALDRRLSRICPDSLYRFDLRRPECSAERRTYWRPPRRMTGKDAWDETESADRLRQVLEQVVADSVPRQSWALSLSGGRDSGAIWALADRKLGRPVCLEFPGYGCDERSLIEQTSGCVDGPGPLWIDAGVVDPLTETEALIGLLDAPPFATTYFAGLAAKAAAVDGRRILLMGNGGDEWLGGAPRPYLEQEFVDGRWLAGVAALLRLELPERHRHRDLLWSWGLRPAAGRLAKRLGLRRGDRPRSWLSEAGENAVAASRWPDWVKHQAGPVRQLLGRTLHLRRTSYELWALEQVAAGYGVEIRLPLMHRRLVDFAFMVPPRWVIGGRREKHLLRLALAGLYAPGVADRRSRTTFDEVYERRIDQLRERFLAHEWSLAGSSYIDKDGLDRLILGSTAGAGMRELISLYLAGRFVATLCPAPVTPEE